uniref:Ig-like domain-containing protein n=1 Tax=Haplochromis burtoni TaxID=8153 RepID=A0A3Q2VI58_HAPBU
MFFLCCEIFPVSQSVRTGFIGGEVLLPCVYSEKLPKEVNAFWRDKDDNVVLDIFNGREGKMDPKFKSRVFSFPNQYETGNFSILIKGLRADDAGPYDCHITKVDYQTKITLKVTGQFSSTSTLLGTPQCLCSSSSGLFFFFLFLFVSDLPTIF